MAGVLKRMLVATTAAATLVGVWSASASAHVTINTYGPVAQGSFAKIGFSVPNERDDAGTVKLSVQIPEDHPLAFVSVQALPGWEVSTTTRQLDEPLDGEGGSLTEVVDTITWTATGDTQIAPGQFELFWISAGQMPTDVDSLTFPAVQTYSSGEEVAWIETQTAGAAEPEHPAPTVQLVAADGEAGATPATTVPVATSTSGDDDSNTLAVVALVVGGLGLIAGIAALGLARRKAATPTPTLTAT